MFCIVLTGLTYSIGPDLSKSVLFWLLLIVLFLDVLEKIDLFFLKTSFFTTLSVICKSHINNYYNMQMGTGIENCLYFLHECSRGMQQLKKKNIFFFRKWVTIWLALYVKGNWWVGHQDWCLFINICQVYNIQVLKNVYERNRYPFMLNLAIFHVFMQILSMIFEI